MKYFLHKVEFLFCVPSSQYLADNLNAARQGESFCLLEILIFLELACSNYLLFLEPACSV